MTKLSITTEFELERKGYRKERFSDGYGDYSEELKECHPTVANLVSSATNLPEWHLPVLDLDFPCQLVPSSTEGHFHLYFDKPIKWDAYLKLLDALVDAEIIEEGWAEQSIVEGMTLVRTPETQK